MAETISGTLSSFQRIPSGVGDPSTSDSDCASVPKKDSEDGTLAKGRGSSSTWGCGINGMRNGIGPSGGELGALRLLREFCFKSSLRFRSGDSLAVDLMR